MPGPYAHLTLVHVLRARLARGEFPELTAAAQDAVALATSYCDLGAIAPDCSYFAVAQPGHDEWGDMIHARRAIRVLQAAARAIHAEADPRHRRRGLAWALGFASHVVADAVVHPIVNHIAGDYYASEENRRRHARCEIHQDTYIYQRLGLHEIGRAGFMRALAAGCGDGYGGLDPWIAGLWVRCLNEVYGVRAPRASAEPQRWFRAFCALVDVADEGHHVPFLRQRLDDLGRIYLVPAEIDPRLVAELWTPEGTQDYAQVFERAVLRTAELWIDVARAAEGDGAALAARPDINLNDGTAGEHGPLIYWSGR